MNKGYIEFFAAKNKKMNEHCAAIRRDEFRLVVNRGKSDINWKLYN